MERALLVKPQDITAANVQPLLERAEEFRARFPQDFEGWYLLGLCQYRLGRTGEALYCLTRAHAVAPGPELESLIRRMGGDPARASAYRFQHYVKQERSVILTYVLLFSALAIMSRMVLS